MLVLRRKEGRKDGRTEGRNAKNYHVLDSAWFTSVCSVFKKFCMPLNSDNKPWAYICSKGFFAGLIFGGAYLIIGGNFAFQNGLDLAIKTA